MYIIIDGKWINNGKIVTDVGGFNELFGFSVVLSGSTAIFGAPYKE